VLIFKALHAAKRPLSVETLAHILRGKADKVTIYRTLESFVQAGLVIKVSLHRDREYYELAPIGGEHHHHLVCNDCGSVEDVHVPEPKDFEKNILKQSRQFKSITSHSLEFFGICRFCEQASHS